MFPNSILAHQAFYINALRHQQLLGSPQNILPHSFNEAPSFKTDPSRGHPLTLRSSADFLLRASAKFDDVTTKQPPASPNTRRSPLPVNTDLKLEENTEAEVHSENAEDETLRVTSPSSEQTATTLKFGIASILAATERDATRNKRGEAHDVICLLCLSFSVQ